MHQPLVPVSFPQHKVLPDGAKLLAADVGGTKTHLGLFEVRHDIPVLLSEAIYPSKKYNSMSDFVRRFMADAPLPERLSIAFAGPVQNGNAWAANLDWRIDTSRLSAELGIPRVFLINDLEAAAYGLAALTENDLITVSPGGAAVRGNAGILAPGTGLGEAGLFWDGTALHPFATEGGHTDFTPREEFDYELSQYLQGKFGHVSWERVLSGQGLSNIYNFLREVKKWEESVWVQAKLPDHDLAAAIGLAAQEGCPMCVVAVRVFVRYLAIEASNLALKLKATGGIFIGGGIPPKIWNEHLQAIFLEHFFQVGRLRTLLEAVPVYLVLNPKTVLLGAAWYGR